MLDREFRIALKQFCSVMAFMVLMPFIYLLDSSFHRTGTVLGEYMAGGYALLWLISTLHLGYNIFSAEERDGSIEYLLSLPVRRSKLVVWKTGPRILVLYVTAELSSLLGVDIFSGRLLLLAFIVFAQVCGFVLGVVGRRSWSARLLLFVLVIFAWIVNSTAVPGHYMLSSIPGAAYILLEIAVLAVLLLPVYSIWDLRPMRIREKRLAIAAIGPLMVMALPVVNLFSGP